MGVILIVPEANSLNKVSTIYIHSKDIEFLFELIILNNNSGILEPCHFETFLWADNTANNIQTNNSHNNSHNNSLM